MTAIDQSVPTARALETGPRDAHRPRVYLTLSAVSFLVFLAVGVGLNHPGFRFGMIYDSVAMLLGNSHFFARQDLGSVIGIVPQRPVVMLSFYVNYLLTGLDSYYLRLCNAVMLAATGTVLAFLTIAVIGVQDPPVPVRGYKAKLVAFVTGLLFVVHPLQSFVVLYEWQRFGVMACFFYYASLAAYVGTRVGWFHRTRLAYLVTGLLFLGGMLSKENVVTLPVVLFLAEVILFRQARMQLLARAGVIALITVPAVVIQVALTFMFQGLETPQDQTGLVHRILLYYGTAGVTVPEVLLTQCRVVLDYLTTILVPFSSMPLMKAETISRSFWDPPTTFPAVCGVIVLVATGLLLCRKKPVIAFAIFFFFITLAPESLLIPQYLYVSHRAILPMAGVLIGFAYSMMWLMAQDESRKVTSAVTAAAVLIAALWGTQTFSRAKKWEPLTLWEEAFHSLPTFSPHVETVPYCDILGSYGEELSRAGRYDAAIEILKEAVDVDPLPGSEKKTVALVNLGRIFTRFGKAEEGLQYFRRAVEVTPRGAHAWYNLGVALVGTGNKEEGIRCLRKAIKFYPADTTPRLYLADLLKGAGDLDGAIEQYSEASKLEPTNAAVHNALGAAWEKTGNTTMALGSYRRAVELAPASAEFHFNLAKALTASGLVPEAITHYRKAIASKPALAPAHANLGVLLLKSGDPVEALKRFEAALQLDGHNPDLHYWTGITLSALGNTAEAMKEFQTALELNPDHQGAMENLKRLHQVEPRHD
ncbi:MAG: tetratricopeptide repeat protein [Desulfomonile tiedjei]|nr:tetratricopeptide repeat protein [Desulfomonile tiedjei]